jgi:hypothetical protein
MTCISLSKWSNVENVSRKHFKKGFKITRTIFKLQNFFAKTRGGGGENCRGLNIEPGQW